MLRSLQLSILIILITIVATIVVEIYPGVIGTPNQYNVEDLMNKVDTSTGTGVDSNPLSGIPIVGDLVTLANSFLASMGLLGRLILNVVFSYGFFVWLGFPAIYALAGQMVVGLFHITTLIELKTGRTTG